MKDQYKAAIGLTLSILVAGCASNAPSGELSDDVWKQIPRPHVVTAGEGENQGDGDAQQDASRQGAQYYGGTGKFLNQIQPQSQIEENEDGGVTAAFKNMDLRVLAKAILGDSLGEPFSIDPRVTGSGTLETSGAVSKEALRIAFEALLKTKGYALVNTSTGYTILPQAEASRSVNGFQFKRPASASLPGFSVHVVPLKHTSPSEMQKLIEPFSVRGGVLRADDNRGILILAGTSQELSGMFRAIDTFDVDRMAGMSFAIYPLKYVEAEQVIKEINDVFAGPDGSGAPSVYLIPVPRINRIIGVAPNRRKLLEIENWIARLDIGESAPGRRIYVYNVRNGRATDIAATLNLIMDSGYNQGNNRNRTGFNQRSGSQRRGNLSQNNNRQGQQQNGQGLGEDYIRIVPSEENNSLVIMATPSEFGIVETALKRIDVPPRQVLVEVTLAEVSLTDELRYGLQWHFEFGDNQVTFGKSTTPSAEVPGFSWSHTSNTSASAVLNALASLSDVQVISSPKLMTLNNHPATLQFGDEVPVPTSSAVSTAGGNSPIVNTIQYRNTGVILSVTPRINEGGLIMLDVEQEVSTVAETSSSGIDAPTIQQRKMTTTVAVQNGSTIALGGLIRNSISRSNSGVPLLKDIPLLGEAFKSSDIIERRSELVILLTPRIISNDQETREAMDYLQKEFRSLIGPLKTDK